MEKTKPTAYSLVAITLCFLVFTSCSNQDRLPKWLIGKWKTSYDGFMITEEWSLKNDHLEALTTWNDSGKKEYEHVKLFYQEESLIYQIKTASKKMEFRCENCMTDTLRFINNANDFPKQIIYVRPISNEMSVWVCNFKGDPNEMRFPFKKIASF
jgi:hypothetical protein